MDEAPEPDAEPAGSLGPRGVDPEPTLEGPGLVGQPLVGPEADALAAEAADIRRLVDAGAGSPEELRALAERLRAHRAREDALWRAQVKPTLKPKRAGVGGLGQARLPDPEAAPSSRHSLVVGLALLGAVVLVVLLAASSTVLWVVLPVVGVLVAAWWQGKQQK